MPGSGARRAFTRNVAANALFFAFNSLVMFVYTPVVLRHLGESIYGLISLASSAVIFTTIFASGLNVSLSRHLLIALEAGDETRSNRIFNTALFLSLATIAALALPISALIAWAPDLLRLPPELHESARIIFAAVFIAALLAILSGVFGVASLIRHRFDLRNIVRAAGATTRLAIVLAFASDGTLTFQDVAASLVLSAAVSLIGDVVIWRRLTPDVKLSASAIDPTLNRELLSTGGWSMLNQVGTLFLMQSEIFVVHFLFGAAVTGQYGALLALVAVIHAIAETAISVLWPLILSCFASGDFDQMHRIARRATRLLSLTLALPVGVLGGLSQPFITLWLGPTYAHLGPLLSVMIVYLPLCLAMRAASYVLTAHNEVRVQALSTLAFAAAQLALAFTLATWLNAGLIGVALASAIIWTLRNAVFMPALVTRVTGASGRSLTLAAIPGVLGTILLMSAGWLSIGIWPARTWLLLIAEAGGLTAIYVIVAYVLGLTQQDRAFVQQYALRRQA